MKCALGEPISTPASRILLILFTTFLLAWAQEAPAPPSDAPPEPNPAPSGSWRRVGERPQNPTFEPASSGNSANPGDPQNASPDNGANDGPNYLLPSHLTIQPGTYVTVRLNQALSSDVNQAGDAFAATLVRPIVVDGVVVAQRGQTLGGRVAEARKAGRVEGVSRLAIQLTDLPLVDGQQLPIRAQLINRSGSTSTGRDAGAIAGTAGVGAAVGAAVEGGVGAGVGAAAGAALGTLGVLLTRGHPTVIYPESVLTFRIEAPVTFSTDRAPQAFRSVQPTDYDRPSEIQTRMAPPPSAPCAGYGCAPPPPPYAYGYYGPAYYPYYWGPSFAFGYGFGPRFFYGPRFYYGGRGFYRGRWR